MLSQASLWGLPDTTVDCFKWVWSEARGRTLLLPLGSIEDRPWGPASLDCIIAAVASCKACGMCNCLVTPPLCYGVGDETHSWGLYQDISTLVRLLETLAEWARRLGARLIVVNAHAGNRPALSLAKVKWLDVWEMLEEYGVRGFQEQVRFEKSLSAGSPEALRLLEHVALSICEEIEEGKGCDTRMR